LINCSGETFTGIMDADSSFIACSCDDPTLPADVTFTYVGAGCTDCFCYTLNNTTSVDQDVTYASCGDDMKTITLAAGEIAYVCLIYGSQILPTGVTSTLGDTCIDGLTCNPCYSTTTTTTIL